MMKIIIILILTFGLNNCAVTSFTAIDITKGESAKFDLKEFSKSKGKIKFQKIKGADWEVPIEGLINFKDPKVQEKGLKKGNEPIQINLLVLDHPTYGRYFIDTGMADIFKKDSSEWPFSYLVKSAMKTDSLKINITTGEFIKKENVMPKGVFLTHMHLDHIMGTNDIPKDVPIYTGPKEAEKRSFINMFGQGTSDRLLSPERKLNQLQFPPPDENTGLAVLDFFGDKSLYIFHAPGHTVGSLVFLFQSDKGPQLILGDTSHTVFGWENNVTPGEFTEDQKQNAISLNALQNIAKEIPGLEVHPGHQSFPEKSNKK